MNTVTLTALLPILFDFDMIMATVLHKRNINKNLDGHLEKSFNVCSYCSKSTQSI